MNKANLKKAIYHIKHNVKKKNFDMGVFRIGDNSSPECGSVGCIIGHCTVLDDPANLSRFTYGDIKFCHWSYQFFGIYKNSAESILIWDFMFSGLWSFGKNTPTKKQAVKRMKYVLKHGTYPSEFIDSITGRKNFNLVM